MNSIESAFQEFVDAIESAEDEAAFERVGLRLTRHLGFRWFAYLRMIDEQPVLISSYPKVWTRRYFDLRYQQLDPVVLRARAEQRPFGWSGVASSPVGSREQRRFFDEATTFGIKSGITVPIRSGFGRMAAFTLAGDEWNVASERLAAESKDVFQLLGLYFHTHVSTRLGKHLDVRCGSISLSQRERQCLGWVAQGKTVADIAVLVGIGKRTVVFHLENARNKLNAASIAQCVAEAFRRGLLP
jgi:LuxR family transcriptional activator of conjugal transfer of Ti plasmids